MRRVIVAPSVVVALAALLVNDHALKGAGLLPGWLTGKASDLAGLYLVAALVGAGLAPHVRPWVSVGLAGLAFGLMKTWQPMTTLASTVLGATLRDPSDLVALAVLPFAARTARLARRRTGAVTRLELATAALAALACGATSPQPPQTRNFPTWAFVKPDREVVVHRLGLSTSEGGVLTRRVGCASLELWVSKSGKEGMAVSIAGGGCPAQVTARFRLEHQPVGEQTADVTSPDPAYLPFPFDNERAWNEGRVDGTLELTVRTADAQETFSLPMKHAWDRPHRLEKRLYPDDGPQKPPMPVATGPAR